MKQESTWSSAVLHDGIVIDFLDFKVVPSYTDAKKSGWVSEIETTLLGQIQLCVDSDVGYCYKKHD
jgi:hypothetical protein